MAEVKPAEVSAILREQLSGFKSESELEEVGSVLQVGDGIARIYGLSKVQSGELIEFETGLQGIVLNLEQDNVGAVLLGASTGISEGSSVKRTGRIASIKVGDGMLGRVIDTLGNPIDGKGDIKTKQYFPTEFIKSTKSFKLVGKIGAKEKKGSQNKIYFYFSY